MTESRTPAAGQATPDDGAASERESDRPASPLATRGIELRGRSLREHTARGTIINTCFLVALSGLGLVRGFVLAVFLTRADFGVWGLLVVSLGTLLWLKQAGIGDKYIQQEDADQELAFQRAFTLEVMLTALFTVILAVALPVYAVIFDEPRILAPGLVVIALLPAGALQAPLWVYARNMDFLRQRTLQAIDPVAGFVVAVIFAAAGAGYWALAAGVLAGGWLSAAAAVRFAPYALRLRYDRGTMRTYFKFSWPLLISNGSALVIAQAAVITVDASLGVAAVGAMALASTINSFVQRVDGLITGTLYPAICAVRDRISLLEESFVKSNRLALMWAMPFGCAIALFIDDLIQFGIGEKWRPAAELLQITGLVAAVGHVAFNWDAYMRALDRTKPIAVATAVTMITFISLGIPLILAFGLPGLAAGIALQTLANIGVRIYYLRQIFFGFSFLRHAVRAIVPTLPPVAAVLSARSLETGERTLVRALAELVLYVAITVIGTWLVERRLLKEAISYIGRRQTAAGA